MARFAFQLFLLFSFQIKESRPATPVFVQTGGDVLLDIEVGGSDECVFVHWIFNQTKTLLNFPCSSGPESEPSVNDPRIEFFKRNYTMKLKNLRKSDNGIYTAGRFGNQGKITVEYKVTVQDPVSPAELTVGSILHSSTSCNLTVTCSTGPSKISSTVRCDTETCSQDGGEQPLITQHGDSLLVYLSNESVICNHSNHVSWINDTRNIKHLCPLVGVSKTQFPTSIAIRAAVTLALLLLAVVFTIYILRKWKRGRSNSPN